MLLSLKELVEIKYKLCMCRVEVFFFFFLKYVCKMLGVQKVSSLPTQHPYLPLSEFLPNRILMFRNPSLIHS